MEPIQIAVIDQTNEVPPGELARAAAAVQKQVARDFGPVWNVAATVDTFPTLADKPLDSWPVVIRKKLGVGGPGVHVTRDGDKPFALVRFTPNSADWAVTLSHEILEMLVDPLGTLTTSGPSPLGDGRTVDYLREVCDPCQGPARAEDPFFEFQYLMDDVFVSDFVFPTYYTGIGPGQYSFTGRVTRPRELLAGGYFTWFDPLSRLWQYTFFDGTETITEVLGPDLSRPDVHLRGLIDRRVTALLAAKKPRKRRAKRGKAPPDRAAEYRAAAEAQARWWQAEIDRVIGPESEDDA